MPLLGFNLDLGDQLSFYGSYHSKPLNQLIHFVFVPIILWSVAVWLAYTPALASPDLSPLLSLLPACCQALGSFLALNGSFVLLAAYSLYYILLAPIAGLSWTTFAAVPLWVAANAFQQLVPTAWAWALGLHVLGWVMQIVPGHAMVEKRRPALLDSFFQSLVLAPLFVWFELLFLLGYRKQLHAEVQRRVRANIEEFRRSQQPLLASSDAAAAK